MNKYAVIQDKWYNAKNDFMTIERSDAYLQ